MDLLPGPLATMIVHERTGAPASITVHWSHSPAIESTEPSAALM
jgi:hypothetical protein